MPEPACELHELPANVSEIRVVDVFGMVTAVREAKKTKDGLRLELKIGNMAVKVLLP